MPQVKQLYEILAGMAPVALAEGWDNVGLLVDAGRDVSRVLVTLDITADTVQEATEKGCELIVSHHPVIFSPLKRLDDTDVAYQLVKKDVSAICMHTNLDAADGGVNDVLADFFGLREREPFADGCGRIGTVEPTTAEALARRARRLLNTSVKFADAGKPIRRLAVVSGAGGSMFQDAIAAGADCLLTGEANHHAALDAVRLGMSLVAATHYATEQPAMEALALRLAAACPEVEVLCSETGRDSFSYI